MAVAMTTVQFVEAVERRLGYHWNDPGLVLEAFSHPYMREKDPNWPYETNERLWRMGVDIFQQWPVWLPTQLSPEQAAILPGMHFGNGSVGLTAVRLGLDRLSSVLPSGTTLRARRIYHGGGSE